MTLWASGQCSTPIAGRSAWAMDVDQKMIVRFILKKLYLWILLTLAEKKRSIHDGIALCDVNFNDHDDQDFFGETKRALELIARTDRRRYQRVREHIDYIVNTELAAFATYNPGKICKVDFGRLKFSEHPEWSHYMYAATLVHEATHGYIEAKGFRYIKPNRLRIERICRSEENRFLSRIDSEWGDALHNPFNPQHWDRKSGFEQVRKQLQRIAESRARSRAQDADTKSDLTAS